MRIFIILLFISFNSFGQLSYSDIMSINSEKQFKKIMIENYYEFALEDEDGNVDECTPPDCASLGAPKFSDP